MAGFGGCAGAGFVWAGACFVLLRRSTTATSTTATTTTAADNPPLVLLRGGGVQVAVTNDTSGPWYPSEE